MSLVESSWRECSSWLTRVGLLSIEHKANWSTATIKDLAYFLRDGVQLCRLLNLLQPNCLDLKDIALRPQMAQFLCLRNIRNFLQVCKNVFELKEADLFQPSMLFDLSDFGKVLSTLSKLSECPKANHVSGFSVMGQRSSLMEEEMCQNFEDLASPEDVFEEDYYSVVVQTEEDIYQDLCYIDRQSNQPPVTLREKRDYVKGELLETEGNYIEALNMLKKKFIKPLSGLMKEEDKRTVFLGIKELSEIHTGFLSDLNRVLTSTSSSSSTPTGFNYGSQSKTLGDCFAHWKLKFVIYGDYCANLARAQGLIEDLTAKNEILNQEISKCEKEANGGRFKLRDLLSMPMQRILKYHLLLEKLLAETSWEMHGYDEYKSIEKARDVMMDVAEFTNEVKRDSETLSIVRQIEGSIYDLKMPDSMELKDYGRLQRDGELKIKGHDDNRLKSRYVFVFDKVMLMCKTTRMMDKLLRGEQYSYKHSLCLQEYRIEDVPGVIKKTGIRDVRWSFSWNLVHHKEKNVYTMFAQTEEQKKRWIKALEDALLNIQPEECRKTDHLMVMNTFEKGSSCTLCGKFLKGLFYQGYRCMRCDLGVHRECITSLHKCGTPKLPQLPPRPPLLPIPNQSATMDSTSMILVSPTESSRNIRIPSSSSPPLPLNNLNSPTSACTSLGTRLSISHENNVTPHYVNLSHLENYSWYAGDMDRDSASNILEKQENGTFLVRVRPAQASNDDDVPSYALSLKWNDQIKHMKILLSNSNLYYLSESRYFKSIVELVHWYQNNSLAESFSGLDACLENPYEKTEGYCSQLQTGGVVNFNYNSNEINSGAAHQTIPLRVGTPS